MATEAGDIACIQDEDVLRRMWQSTEDFARKKQIRAHMYKLREQRLKEFYTTGEVLSDVQSVTPDASEVTAKSDIVQNITKYSDTGAMTLTDSIEDQGFMAMKSREIRDSESPTRTIELSQNKGNNAQTFWKVESSSDSYHAVGSGGQYDVTTQSQRRSMAGENDQVISDVATSSGNRTIHDREGNRILTDGTGTRSGDASGDGLHSFGKLKNGDLAICTADDASRAVTMTTDGKIMSSHQSSVRSQQHQAWSSSTSKSSSRKVTSSSYGTEFENLSDKNVGDVWIEEGPGGVTRTVRVVKKVDDHGDGGGVTRITRVITTTGTSGDYIDSKSGGTTTVTVEKKTGKETSFHGDSKSHGNILTSSVVPHTEDYWMEDSSGGAQRVITKIIRTSGIEKDGHYVVEGTSGGTVTTEKIVRTAGRSVDDMQRVNEEGTYKYEERKIQAPDQKPDNVTEVKYMVTSRDSRKPDDSTSATGKVILQRNEQTVSHTSSAEERRSRTTEQERKSFVVQSGKTVTESVTSDRQTKEQPTLRSEVVDVAETKFEDDKNTSTQSRRESTHLETQKMKSELSIKEQTDSKLKSDVEKSVKVTQVKEEIPHQKPEEDFGKSGRITQRGDIPLETETTKISHDEGERKISLSHKTTDISRNAIDKVPERSDKPGATQPKRDNTPESVREREIIKDDKKTGHHDSPKVTPTAVPKDQDAHDTPTGKRPEGTDVSETQPGRVSGKGKQPQTVEDGKIPKKDSNKPENIPTETKPGSYTTTYQWSFTPQKINVEVSASHAAFASSLRAPSLSPERGFLPYRSSSDVTYTCGRKSPTKSTSKSSLERTTPTPRQSYSPELRKTSRTSPVKTSKSPTQDQGRKPSRKGSEPRAESPKRKTTPITVDGRSAAKTPKDSKSPGKDKRKLSGTRRRSGTPGVSPSTSPERDTTKPRTRTTSSSSESSRLTYNRDVKIKKDEKYTRVTDFIEKEREDRETKKIPRAPGVDRLREKSPEYSSDGSLIQEFHPRQPHSEGYPKDNAFTPIRPYTPQTNTTPRRPSTSSSPSTSPERKAPHTLGSPTQKPTHGTSPRDVKYKSPEHEQPGKKGQVTPDKRTQPKTTSPELIHRKSPSKTPDLETATTKPDKTTISQKQNKPKPVTSSTQPKVHETTPEKKGATKKPSTRSGEKPEDDDVSPASTRKPSKPGTRPGEERQDFRVTPDGRKVTRKPGTRPRDEPDDYDETPDGRGKPSKPGTRPEDEPEDYDVTPDGRKVPRKTGTRPGDEPEDYYVTPDGRKVPRKPGTRPGDEPDDYDKTPDGRRKPSKPGTRPGDEPEDYYVTPDGRKVPRKPETRPGDEPEDYYATPDGRKVPRKPGMRPGDQPDDYDVTPDGRKVPRKPGTRPGEEPDDYDKTPDGRRKPSKPGTRPGDEPEDYYVTPDGRKVPRKPETRPGDEPEDYYVTPDGRKVPRKPGMRPGDQPDDYDVTPDGRKVPRKPGTRPGEEPDDYDETPDGRKKPSKPGTGPGDEPEDYDVTPDGRKVPRKPGTRPGDEPEDYYVTPDGRKVPRKPGTRPGDEPDDYDVTPDGRKVPRKPGTRRGDEPEDYDVTPDGRKVSRKPGTRPGEEPDDYDKTPDGRRKPSKPGTRLGDEPEDLRVTPDGRKVPRKPGTQREDEPDDYDVTPDGRKVPRKPGSRPGDEPDDYDVTPDGRKVPRKPGTRRGDEPEDYYVTPDGRKVPRKPGTRLGDEPEDYYVTPDGRKVPRKPGTRPGDEPEDYDVTPDGRKVPRKPGTRPGEEPDDYDKTPDGRKKPSKPGTRLGDEPEDYYVTPDGRKVPRKPGTRPGEEPDDYDKTPDGRRGTSRPGTRPEEAEHYKVTPDDRKVARKPGTRPGDEPDDYDETPDGRKKSSKPGTRPRDEPEDYDVTPDGRKVPRKPGTRPGEEPEDYYVTPDGRKVPRKPGTRSGNEPHDYDETPDGRRKPNKPGTRPGDEPEDYYATPDGLRRPSKPGTRPGDEPEDYYVTPDGRKVPRKPGTRPGDGPDDYYVTPDGRKVPRKPETRPGEEPDDYDKTPDGRKVPRKPGTRRGDESEDYDVTPDGRKVSRKPGTRPDDGPDDYHVTPDGRKVPRKPGNRPEEEPEDYYVTPDGRKVPRPGDEPDDYDKTPDGRKKPSKPGTRLGDEPEDYYVTPDGRKVPRKPGTRPGEEPDDYDKTPDGRRKPSKPGNRPEEEPEDYYVTPDGRKVPRPGDEPDDYDKTPDGRRIPSKPGTRPGDEPEDYYVTPDGRKVPRKPGMRPGDQPDDYDVTPDGRKVPRKPGIRPGEEPDDYDKTPDGRKKPSKPGTRLGDEPEDYYVTPDGRKVPRKPGTRPGDEPEYYDETLDGRRKPSRPGTRPGDERDDYDKTPDGRRIPSKPGTRPGDEPDDYYVTPDGRKVPRKPGTRPGDEPEYYDETLDGRRKPSRPGTRPEAAEDYKVTPDGRKVPRKPGTRPGEVGKNVKVTPDGRRVPMEPGLHPGEEPRDYKIRPDGGRVLTGTHKPDLKTTSKTPSYPRGDPNKVPSVPGSTDDRKFHSKPTERAPKHEYVTPDGRKVTGKKPTTRPGVRTINVTSKISTTRLVDSYVGTTSEKKIISRPETKQPESNKTVPGKRVPGQDYVTFDRRTVTSKKPVGKSVPSTPTTSRVVSAPKTTPSAPTTRTTGTPTTKKPERGYASPTVSSLVRKPSDRANTPVQKPKESPEQKQKGPVVSTKPTRKRSNEPEFGDEPRRRSATSVTDYLSERHSEIRQQRTTRTEYEYDDEQLDEYLVDNEQEYLPIDGARKQPKSTRTSSGPILTPKQGVRTPTKKLLPQQKSEPKMRTPYGTAPKSKTPSSPLKKESEVKPRPGVKSKQQPKRTKRTDSETSGEEDESEFLKETVYSEDREYTLTEQMRTKVRSKVSPESEGRLKEPKGLIEFPESPREQSPGGRPRFTTVDDKRVEELRPRYPDSVTEAEDDSEDDYPQRRIKNKPETLTEEDEEYKRRKQKKSPEREEPVDSEDETEVSVAKRVNKFMDAARKAGSSPLPSRPEDITLKGLDDTINSYMESNEIDEEIESVNAVRKAKSMFENIAYSQVNKTARRELQRQDDILDRPSVFDAKRKYKPEAEPSDDETRIPERVPTSTQERKPVEPEVLRKENLLKLGICCTENIFNRDIFEKTESGKDTFPRRKTPSPERPVGKFDTFPTRKSPVKDHGNETPQKRVTPDRAKSPEKARKMEEPQTPKFTTKPSDTKPVTSRYPFSKPKPEVKPQTQQPMRGTSVTKRYPFSDRPSDSDRPKVNDYTSPEDRFGKKPSARIPEGTDLKSPALLKEPFKPKGKESYDEEYPGYDAPRGKEGSPVSRRPGDSYPMDRDGSYPRSDSPKKGYTGRSPVRGEKSPSPNRVSRGGSRSPSRSVPRDRGYPFEEPRDVKERSPSGRRKAESPHDRRTGRRGSPDSRSPSDRQESPSRSYPREKSPLDSRDYPGSRSPTGRRGDYPDDRTMRSPSPDFKRPGSPRKDYRPRDQPEDSPSKVRRPSGKTYPEEGRPIHKSPTRKDYTDDETDKYRRPSGDNTYGNYPGGRSKPREGSPRTADEVTVSKFGVSLKKTTTGSSIMKKLFADVGRRESELDRIFDLEVLETLLERAKGYDERRLIRQQIRLVKKMIENGEIPDQPARKKSEPDVYDSLTQSRDTDSLYSKPKKDDRREPGVRSSKSPEKKVFDNRPVEKTQPGRFQPIDSVRRRSEDKHYSTEFRRQSSEHITSSVEFKRSSPSKPSDTLNKTIKKSYIDDETREESLTDSITSSYGIGPTDEKGMPLFGLKALRRQNKTTQEVEPTFVPFEEEPSPRDIKDSSGRPLFGLKALQISKDTTRTGEDKPVSEPNDRPLMKDILNKRDKEARGNAVSQPQQHTPSRFRDTFAQNRNEDFIRRESEAEDVKRGLKDRGQSLKSMIQRHESLTESDKKRPESITTSSSFTSSTVVRSSAVRKADGGISVKSHVVQGETISKDGEKPKSRVVTAEYSYETPERGYDEFGNEGISDEEYRTREAIRSSSKTIKSRSNTTESVTSRTSRKSLSPERKPVDDWPADDSTTRTRRPISDKLSQLSRKFSNEPEDLVRKSEPRAEPHYTSHTSSSLLHSNAFSSVTATHTDRNVSSRYKPDDETSPGRRRSATPQDDTSGLNRRRSSTPLDELKESLFRKSSVTHEETDSSSTLFTRYGRGGAVKALSQKFQQPRAEAESPKNTASYPKAGLILRSASFKHTNGDLTPPDSPAYKKSVSLEARVGSPTRSVNTTPRLSHESNERVTEGSRRWSRDGENDFDGYSQTSRRVTTSVTETTDGKSFLGSNTKVTGVKDIISRMKAADLDDVGLESPEDIQARSLLNKFLGASVMMSGMEPLVSASGNSSATLVSQVERQRILQSSPGEAFVSKDYVIGESIEDYGNIDNIWDEKKLRQLLDACTDYEGRRKIRARLRTVMAEKSVCEDVVSAAQEEERLKSGDGSKSVQAGESLLPYLVEKLRTSLLLESLPSQKTEEGCSVTHMEDSGTESGEDFRLLVGLRDSICEGRDVKKSEQLNTKLLTEVQEALQKLQVSLDNRADNSLDPITRETLLQLVTRLQSSLKMAPGIAQNIETKSPNRNRFANRRLARQNRHTVGVTQEELADARRLIQENPFIGSGSAINGSGQGDFLPKSDNVNQVVSDQALNSYAVLKQNSADDVTSNASSAPVRLLRPVHFNTGKLKLPVHPCNAPPKPFLSSQQIQSADEWVRSQIGNTRRLSEGCSGPSPNYPVDICFSLPMTNATSTVPTNAATESKPDSDNFVARDKNDQTREINFKKAPSPPYKNIQYSPSIVNPFEAPAKTDLENLKFPPHPGQGLAHSKSVSNNIQNIRPRSPIKHSLSTDNGDSVLEYDPSLRLFTPEQSVKIAVHKAAINKQLSQEEEKRMRKMSVESDIGSTDDEAMEEDGDISSVSEDDDESTVKLGKIGKTYQPSQTKSQKARRQTFGFQNQMLDQKTNEPDYNCADNINHYKNYDAKQYGKHYPRNLSDEEKKNPDKEPLNRFEKRIQEIQNERKTGNRQNVRSIEELQKIYLDRKEKFNERKANPDSKSQIIQDVQARYQKNIRDQGYIQKSCNPQRLNPEIRSKYESEIRKVTENDVRSRPIWNEDENFKRRKESIKNSEYLAALERNFYNSPQTPMDVSQTDSEISLSSTSTESSFSHAQRLLRLATGDKSNKSSKKVKMKRANTIDIPKPLNYYDVDNYSDYTDDEQKFNAYSSTVKAMKPSVPNLEPKTESDKKFLAFLRQQNQPKVSNAIWSKDQEPRRGNPFAEHQWGNRFSRIKTTFENSDGKSDRPANKPSAPSSVTNARAFWKTADDSAAVIKSPKDSLAVADRPKLTRQGSMLLKKLFQQKEAEEKPTRLPWTSQKENVVVGTLTVCPQRSDVTWMNKPNLNQFSHAPMSAFRPVERKADATKICHGPAAKFAKPIPVVPNKVDPGPTLPWLKDKPADKTLNTTVAKFENLSSRETSPTLVPHREKFVDKMSFMPCYQDKHIPPRFLLPAQSNLVHNRAQALSYNFPSVKCDVNPISKTDPHPCTEIPSKTELFQPVTKYSVDVATTSTVYPEVEPEKVDGFEMLNDSAVSTPEEQMAVTKVMGGPVQQHAVTITQKTHRRNDESENRTTAAKSLTNMLQRFSSPPSDKSPEHARTRSGIPEANYSKSSLLPPNLPTGKTSPISPGNRSASPLCGEEKLVVKPSQLARPSSAESLAMSNSSEELGENCEVVTSRVKIPVSPGQYRTSSLQDLSPQESPQQFLTPIASPVGSLRKSESCHQLNVHKPKRPQSLILPDLPAPQRRTPTSLTKTKSSHALAFPKQFEAVLNQAAVEMKQRTVEEFFAVKKRTKKEVKTNFVELDDNLENVDEAFDALFNSVSSGNVSAKKNQAGGAGDGFRQRNQISKSISSSAIQQIRNVNSSSSVTTTTTKSSDGGYSKISSERSVFSSVGTTKAASTNKPISPFAKFQQLDRQNSGSSSTPSSPSAGKAPLFTFTDPKLSRSASGVKDRLLQWCQLKTKNYKNIQIENFSTSWSNGLAFCALIHHFRPEAFDYDALTPKERRKNFELAFKVAEEEAGIAPLLDVEDMVMMRKPDWKCVFTYVQSIYCRFKNED